MLKWVSNDFDWGEPSVRLLSKANLYKLAQEKTTDEAIEYISNLTPSETSFYVLVIALGAGEYWGANKNGDYFPEAELLKSYKTFEEGHAFFHHQNDDVRKSIGRVLKAFWNDRMKRVELVVELNKAKAKSVLERLERGETVDVSMGCKVEYDVCSICGNKARSRDEYCVHLRYHMNEILPDGRQVYAINPNPVFFDISFVRRGADPTAKVLMKVASQAEKTGDIDKEVPAQKVVLVKPDDLTVLERAFWTAPDFPEGVLEDLKRFHLGDVVATLTALNMQLKPYELIELLGPVVYMDIPKDTLVEYLLGDVRPEIAEILVPYIPKRSLFLSLIEDHLDEPANPPKPDSLIYEAYKQAMFRNLVKTASGGSEVPLKLWGGIWLALVTVLRAILSQPHSLGTKLLKSELKGSFKSLTKPQLVSYYKYGSEKTFLVPAYWYAIAEKLQKGGAPSKGKRYE